MIIILYKRKRLGINLHILFSRVVSLFKHNLTLLSFDVVQNRFDFADVAIAWIRIRFPFYIPFVHWFVVFQKVFTVIDVTFYQHFCKYWTPLINFTIICSLRIQCFREKTLFNIIILICWNFFHLLWNYWIHIF
jgi:hypothetical protein